MGRKTKTISIQMVEELVELCRFTKCQKKNFLKRRFECRVLRSLEEINACLLDDTNNHFIILLNPPEPFAQP